MTKVKIAALALVFLWFFIGGICHFLYTDAYLHIMPPYVPLHLEAILISGVFEILGAIGILVPKTRKMAGYGLILLTILVTPANIHMWLHPELIPDVPPILLLLRLPLQALLILCIWWTTTKQPKNQH